MSLLNRKARSLINKDDFSIIALAPLTASVGGKTVATELKIGTSGQLDVKRTDGNVQAPIQQTLNLVDLNALTANINTLTNGNLRVQGNLVAGNAITTLDPNYDVRLNGYLHLGLSNDYDTNKLGVVTITTDDTSNVFSMAFVRKDHYAWQMGYKSDNTNDFYIHDGSMGMKLTATNSQSWSSVSDERFKKNIEEIDGCLERILQMKGVYYNYTVEEEGNPRKIGVIAQDVYKQFPELVDLPSRPEEPMTVRYSELTPVLLNSIKELYLLHQELRSEVQTLRESLL
jgi:hypothetical protein